MTSSRAPRRALAAEPDASAVGHRAVVAAPRRRLDVEEGATPVSSPPGTAAALTVKTAPRRPIGQDLP